MASEQAGRQSDGRARVEKCVEAAGPQPVARGSSRDRSPPHGRRLQSAWAARTNGSIVVRSIRLVAGLALFAAGLALMLRAQLGLSAWDVLHDAIRSLTPLTFGQVVIAVSVVVLAASVALGIRPGVGTIANSILVGVFTDAILQTPLLQDLAAEGLLPRVGAMLAGIWGIALGTALYIGAKLGAGPRDALMLGIARRSRRSAGAARTAIEASVLIIGIALGGSVGLGTAAFVILIGPAINISFRLFGIEPPRDKTQTNVIKRGVQAVARWGRRGQDSSSSTQTSGETTDHIESRRNDVR
jgi:uncharacterized protein